MTQFFINSTKVLVNDGHIKIRVGDASSPPPQTVAGYLVSGAGDVNYDGTYCLAGTSQGKNYYQKGDYYIAFAANWNVWVIQSGNNGGLNPVFAPDYYNNSMDDTPPTGAWGPAMAPGPPPSLTLTTCYI
jgi:hypothetical protein